MRGDFNGAIRLMEHSIENIPRYTDAFYHLGEAFLAAEMPDKAILAFEEANRFWPRIGANLAGKARALAMQAETGRAEEYFKKALRLDPNDDRIHDQLGWFYLTEGQNDAALDEFRIAIFIAPENALYHSDLALALSLSGNRSAENAIGKAFEICGIHDRNDSESMEKLLITDGCETDKLICFTTDLGRLFFESGRYDLAEEYFLRITALQPHNDANKNDLQKVFSMFAVPEK